MKTIISTFGPLHLVKTASSLKNKGVEVTLIQGWSPKPLNKYIEKIFSILSGRKYLNNAFLKRRPVELSSNIKQCSFSEFLIWFLFILHEKTKIISYKTAAIIGWKLYGIESCRYVSNADIFHVRAGGGCYSIKKAKKMGMKIIVDHSLAHPEFLRKQLTPEYERIGLTYDNSGPDALSSLFVKNMQEADVILVNSSFVKETIINEGVEPEKVKVAYLGVREDFFSLKKEYTYNGKIKILFTGAFNFRKGAEYILKSLAELNRREIEYEMIVVGTYESSTSLICKYNISNIKFIGHLPQDQLKEYLKTSDIYLFPSLAEGCASSGMEAMAAGLPVIATYESGLPINNDANGLLVSSKSVDEIVNAIILLKDNLQMRSNLGINAAATIKSTYTWSGYAENILKIYSELLTSNIG